MSENIDQVSPTQVHALAGLILEHAMTQPAINDATTIAALKIAAEVLNQSAEASQAAALRAGVIRKLLK